MAQQIFINGTDKTSYLSEGSVSVVSVLNNKPDTLNCEFTNYIPVCGQEIEYYQGGKCDVGYSAGVTAIVVDDILDVIGFYKTGDRIFLSPKTANEESAEVLSAVTATKTVNLVSATRFTHAKGDFVAKKKFGGNITIAQGDRLGYAGDTKCAVTANDYSTLFNRKLVVDSYEVMYPLEIISRINNDFVSDDSTATTLHDCETADWTESGVAIANVLDTADFAYGAGSLKLGATGAGTATYSKTISSKNLSTKDRERIWLKFAVGTLVSCTSIKVRLGKDSSNYYEWTLPKADLSEACWFNWTLLFSEYTAMVGTQDLTAVTYLAVVFEVTGAVPIGNIHMDMLTANDGGFSVNGVQRGIRTFDDLRFQYQKCTVVIEKLAKLMNWFWYVDYEKNIRFFPNDTNASPFGIEAGVTTNFSELRITPDITQLKNRQTVRGSEAPSTSTYTQEHVCDGIESSWRLDYKPKTLLVYLDTGAGYVAKTVGVEGLDDPTLFDFIFNFNEKVVRIASIAKPAITNQIKFTYYPYKAIRVRAKDLASISAMALLTGGDGIYDGTMITDTAIKSYNEARARSNAELDAYSNPIVDVSFSTENEGLRAGQLIHVKDSTRGIDDYYLIQQVTARQTHSDWFTYSVQCASTLFGITEFFQFLLQKTADTTPPDSELVDIIVNIDEILSMGSAMTFTIKGVPFYAMGNPPAPTGANDAYCGFCETN